MSDVASVSPNWTPTFKASSVGGAGRFLVFACLCFILLALVVIAAWIEKQGWADAMNLVIEGSGVGRGDPLKVPGFSLTSVYR